MTVTALLKTDHEGWHLELLWTMCFVTRAGRHESKTECRWGVVVFCRCHRVELSDWLALLIITLFARGDHVWAKYSGQMSEERNADDWSVLRLLLGPGLRPGAELKCRPFFLGGVCRFCNLNADWFAAWWHLIRDHVRISSVVWAVKRWRQASCGLFA